MKIIIDHCEENERLTGCCGGSAGLIRLLGRELVGYALMRLARAGAESAMLCSNEHLSEISDFCESFPELRLSACEPFDPDGSDDLLILASDYYYTPVLVEMLSCDKPAVLVCPEAVGSGIISLSADSEGNICGIDPRSEGVCFAGAVYLPKEFAGFWSGGMSRLLNSLFEAGALLSPVTAHYSVRVSDTAAFIELQRHLLDNAGALSLPEPGERVYSHTADGLAGVNIIPPVYIGRDVSIAPGSTVGPYTVIDDDALIGRKVKLAGCCVGRRAAVGAHCVLTDAAVFANATLGSAVRIGEGAAIGRGAAVYDGAAVCAGVSVYAGRKVFEGAYVCEDLIRGSASLRSIGDDGCCSLGSRPSPSDFLRFGAAAATSLPAGCTVAVAHSGTPAAEDMSLCLRMGLTSGGCRVLELGAGTPQLLAFTLSRCQLPLGCFVTGGSEDNVTLMSQGGLPLALGIEREIERAFSGGGTRPVPMPSHRASAEIFGLGLLYEDWLRSMLPKRSRLCVSVRCPDTQVQRLADSIFRDCAEGSGERLVFHISHDGSACSVYSDGSGYILHDRLLLLALREAFRSAVPVAVPYSYTAAADALASAENGTLLRYLTSTDGTEDREARECAARTDNLFVRDGLALAAYITAITEKSGKPFGELISEIPEFYCTQRYVGLTERAGDIASGLGGVPVGSGAELLREGERAVVRRVKGSRGLMIFAESFSAEAAMSLCDELTAKVKDIPKKARDLFL